MNAVNCNTISSTTTNFGNALAFDGVNDAAVTASLFNKIGTATTPITIEMWVKADQGGNVLSDYGAPGAGTGAAAIFGSGHQDSWIDVLTTGEVKVRVWNLQLSLGTIGFGTWNHIVLRYNGSKVDGFLNGIKSTTSTAGTRTMGTGDFYLALARIQPTHMGVNAYFKGAIDEFRVWNVARTDADIISNYTKQLTGNETGLVAYYNFNQGIAGGSNTSITTLNDISPNAKTLTLSGLAMSGTTSNLVTSNSATAKFTNSFTTIASTATAHQWQVSSDNGATWTNITNVQSPLTNALYYGDFTSSTLKLFSDNKTAGTNNLYRDITSNSCGTTTSTVVTLNPTPNKPVITINGSLTFCEGNGVTFSTPSVANTTYQWFRNGVAIGGATSNTYTAIQSGSYSLTATTVGGCSFTTGEYSPNVTSNLSGTSLTNYNAAADNALIPITATEYANLATNLSATKTSAYDATFGLAISSGVNTRPARNVSYGTYPGGQAMINGYVYAVKVKLGTSATSFNTGFTAGYGATTTGDGIALSNNSTISGTLDASGNGYFIIKNPAVSSS